MISTLTLQDEEKGLGMRLELKNPVVKTRKRNLSVLIGQHSIYLNDFVHISLEMMTDQSDLKERGGSIL